MSVVEIERSDGIMVIRMNRPEQLNALSTELRAGLKAAWEEFDTSSELEVAILTGTGRGFCAGEDMKESVARGTVGSAAAPDNVRTNLFSEGKLDKPVIVAVNGFAMGGGFKIVDTADFRVSVRDAVYESSEAKRWLLGGFEHGHMGTLPHAIATEIAFAFRFTAERLYQLGYLNRLVDDPDQLIPTAKEMAAHMLSLPPASRVKSAIRWSSSRCSRRRASS